jgi:hypothetical protein
MAVVKITLFNGGVWCRLEDAIPLERKAEHIIDLTKR